MKFVCALILVENMDVARNFYEKLLGQEVKDDFGTHVSFEGFAIHEKKHFSALIGNKQAILTRSHNMEFYFEENDLESVGALLRKNNIEFLHDIVEQPWGQRVIRVYDPDGHIVEIGETL